MQVERREHTNPTGTRKAETKTHGLAAIMQEIAVRHMISFSSYSSGWVMTLEKGDVKRIICGNTFPLNNASSSRACSDKAAASTIMELNSINHVEHELFLNPELEKWSPNHGVWDSLKECFHRYNNNVVCKQKDGSGGIEVYHVQTHRELEIAVQQLFSKHRDLVISPFKNIRFEYRVIVLNNEVELIFKKIPPFITGDGEKTIAELTVDYLKKLNPMQAKKIAKHLSPLQMCKTEVLEKGATRPIHWKHNLGQGASCVLVGGISLQEENGSVSNEDGEKIERLTHLAQKTSSALGINFGSVDIAELEEQEELTIMEVNSGVMMDNVMLQYPDEGTRIATRIYEKALKIMFNL